MNSLLISDLHLTDVPRDAYRWQLFDWLQATIGPEGVRYLFILGDLTEAKDFHSARLVNRIVDNLLLLFRTTPLITTYILRGNHDGIDPRCAYFKFLGQYPCIKYIETPFSFQLGNTNITMLPHTNKPQEDWKEVDMSTAELLFMHATMSGAVAENGQMLDGIPVALLRTATRAHIWSGDVHVPQKIGRVSYVGAPYAVKFGDNFTPRAVLLENGRKSRDLATPSIQRRILTVDPTHAAVDGLVGLRKGDQVKVRIRLSPAEYVDWQRYKANVIEGCAKFEVELCGLELERVQPKARIIPRRGVKPAVPPRKSVWVVFDDYCIANKVDFDYQKFGLGVLKQDETTTV